MSTGKRYAHVQFADKDAVQRVLDSHKKDPITVGDRPLRLDQSYSWNESQDREPTRQLFISNFAGTQNDMKELLRDQKVKEIRFCTLLSNFHIG
jgi:hypothetical protein